MRAIGILRISADVDLVDVRRQKRSEADTEELAMIPILVAMVMLGGWWAVRWCARGRAPDPFPVGAAFNLALAGGATGGLLFTPPPTFRVGLPLRRFLCWS